MVRLRITILLCAIFQLSYGQLATITEGCIPLEVEFLAPDLSEYYWDFGDLTSSNLQNPTHVFTNDSEYLVKLYEGNTGAYIDSIRIEVFPDITIEIQSNVAGGCEPLDVQFIANIDHHSSIAITGYKWAFGDGNSSSDENPTHQYTLRGTYDVSLEIFTDLIECDQVYTEDKFINVIGIEADFEFSSDDYCSIPTTIDFVNLSEDISGNIYTWSFGNGDQSNNKNPEPITYTQEGIYPISLQVSSSSGCISIALDTIQILENRIIDMNPPDTICLDQIVIVVGDQDCEKHEWILPESNEAFVTYFDSLGVEILFEQGGDKLFYYKCYTSEFCYLDTSFFIHAEKPNANFTISPYLGCHSPQIIEIQAMDTTHSTYLWKGIEGSHGFTDTIICPVQDSFFTERDLVYPYILSVVSQFGCVNTEINTYKSAKPNACFLINPNNGCAPLDVIVRDFSLSEFDIVKWTWDLGDGTIIEQSEHSPITHTYQEEGEYYSKLIIENSEGCIDTSFGVWTTVGEPIDVDFIFDSESYCLGDSMSGHIDIIDDRIDSWYLSGGSGIVSFCQDSPSTIIQQPGVFGPYLMTEYNGCFNKIPLDSILVLGAYADLNYKLNCDNPYAVDFWETSALGDSSTWIIDNEVVSMESSFTHLFQEKGKHIVELIASNDSGCGSSRTIDSIFITDVKAVITGPDTICPRVPYEFDASQSIDVDNDAYSGYKYYGVDIRPLVTDENKFEVALPSGNHVLYVEVIDVNGCISIDSTEFYATTIQAEYNLDPSYICTEGTFSFTNNSTSDYPIVDFIWDIEEYGSTNIENPTISILTGDKFDSIYTHTLYITDAYGCIDSITKEFEFIDFFASISIENGPRICLGDTIIFTANSTTAFVGEYAYLWEFGDGSSSTAQSFQKIYESRGDFIVRLTITEIHSGCTRFDEYEVRVVDIPEAQFSTSVDNVDPICYPEIIDFYNTSTTDGSILYTWYMGDQDIVRFVENPTYAFEKGTHEVVLKVASIYGCEDSDTTSFTLVGPEGLLTVEDDTICLTDPIVASLTELNEVNSFIWDVGDGTIYEDQDMITHAYAFTPPSGNTVLRAILRSELNGCETILEQPINITDVSATIQVEQSDLNCGLSASLLAMSDEANQFEWTFSDGTTNSDNEIIHFFATAGTIDATLKAIDSESGCFTLINEQFTIESLDNGFIMPNVFTPNGDGTNDFLRPVGTGNIKFDIEILEFNVYNRWGNLVYNNEYLEKGWDGKYDGKLAPSEVYAYSIIVNIEECGVKSWQGNVTLIR